jgi:cyclopropane fatty-acyl-phospholipid synthase-like methyltransferase
MANPNSNLPVDQYQNRCELCGGPLKILQVKFLICDGCGLLIRRISDNVENLYKSGWQSPLDNLNLTGGTTPVLGKNYAMELARSLASKDLNGMRILDFGGGRGEMARAMEALGANVVIVDPYSYAQLQKQGLTAVESLEQLKEKKEQFDGAVTIDVIEHLTTPWNELQMIRQLLGSRGWLYLSTPNARSLNARLNKENWREAHNPSHLMLFSPASMEKLLEKAGYGRRQRLRWRVDFSESKLVQTKDWLLRAFWLDGVLRYLAYV